MNKWDIELLLKQYHYPADVIDSAVIALMSYDLASFIDLIANNNDENKAKSELEDIKSENLDLELENSDLLAKIKHLKNIINTQNIKIKNLEKN